MPTYLCRACGTQYPPSDAPPGACPICEDPRQYVPHDTGQAWLTLDELRAEHGAEKPVTNQLRSAETVGQVRRLDA